MSKPKRLEVDRRVGIAMSVLSPSQRSAVEKAIESPELFGDSADWPRRSNRLHTTGQQLYMMRVTPSLRLIYTFVGETVCVLDLVDRATLDRFASDKSDKSSPRGKSTKQKSRSRKPADLTRK